MPSNRLVAYRRLFILGLMFIQLPGCAQGSRTEESPLRPILSHLTSDAPENERVQFSSRLRSEIENVRPDMVSDAEIIEISNLLDDRNAEIKENAASTLAVLGTRARRAAPVLEKAFKREMEAEAIHRT